MTGLYFADQWLLWVLVPLFIVWVAAWWVLPWLARLRGRQAAVRYSNIDTLKRLRPSRRILIRRFVEGIRILVIVLLVLAMAHSTGHHGRGSGDRRRTGNTPYHSATSSWSSEHELVPFVV